MEKSRINPISDKRKAQLPEEARVKLVIYSLGNYLCELCQARVISDRGHEIISRARGGSPIDPFNIIQLCQICHDKQHNKLRDTPPDNVDYLLGLIKKKRLKQGFKEVKDES